MQRDIDAGSTQGAPADAGSAAGAVAQRQWDRLTEADLQEAGGSRRVLARKIATRYEISVREAKRQVRDFVRVMRIAEGGRPSGGKRVRKAAARAAESIAGAVSEGVGDLRRRLAKVLSMGGLAGQTGTVEPLPEPDRGEATASALPGETGTLEPLPGEGDRD